MHEFYQFVSSEDSLLLFENTNDSVFTFQLHQCYTIDREWECTLLELSFVPQFETPTIRVYFDSDFVDHTYVRGSTLPILQSTGILNEDIANIVYEKSIYLKSNSS